MAKTLTAAALVSNTSNAAGSTTRGRLDCTGADGGMIRWTLTNGATGPTTQCEARILMARKQASMPSAGSAGTGDDDWQTVFVQGGGTQANAITSGSYVFGQEAAYIETEFTGNTGQAVAVRCTADTFVG